MSGVDVRSHGRITVALQSLSEIGTLLQSQEADCAGLAEAAEEANRLLSGADYMDGSLRDKVRRKLHLALSGKHLEPLVRLLGHARELREDVTSVVNVNRVVDALDCYESAVAGRQES